MSGLEPGFQLGHYRILRSLGSGGMADVYEAHDDHLDRTVALKILPVEYSRNPQLVQRFQKEVRAAAKLNHRNIVTVFEVGQQDSWHFFSMRLLTGGDLRDRIQSGLSPVESLAILRELADAFAHAHARGFVHRDVKPENVMFDEQGFPVLTDFGIAKALNAETRMTRTGMTMGTPRYLAPEQASGKPVDARADLYSLGVILHEMLTGRPPYDAEESMAVIFKHVTEPIPQLPADFARYQPLLEKLMAKEANQRIGSAEELIREIDAIAPRAPTGELKQSQLRTSENPLIAAHLLTPSPLRTPAPKTPRPVPPSGDTGLESGEVIVRPPPVTARPPASRPAPAPAPAARAAAPVRPAVAPSRAAAPAPRQRRVWPAALAIAVALAGAGLVAYRMLPAPTTPATSPPPAAATVPAQLDAQAAARRKAEEEAAARKLAEQQAAQKQAAELEAKQRAAAQAEAQRRAAAEAEATRKAEAEAVAKRQAAEAEAKRKAEAEALAKRQAAEAEARKKAAEADGWAEVEAANKRREAEAEREAAAKRQADQKAAAADAATKKKEDAAKQQAAKEAEEEKEAKERTRRPTGF